MGIAPLYGVSEQLREAGTENTPDWPLTCKPAGEMKMGGMCHQYVWVECAG